MEQVDFKRTTQEGPVSESGGESLRSSERSPTYSGGGKSRFESVCSRIFSERGRKRGKVVKRSGVRSAESGLVIRSQSLSLTRKQKTAEPESAVASELAGPKSRECLEGSLWQERTHQQSDTEAMLSDDSLPAVDLRGPRTGSLSEEGKCSRQKYLAQKRTEASSELEAELENRMLSSQNILPALNWSGNEEGSDERLVVALGRKAIEDVGVINMVASRSGNLKGTFQRALKNSASSLKAVVEVLSKRTSTEETERLNAANARLESEVAELREELVKLRGEMAELRAAAAPSPREENARMETSSAGPSSEEELRRSILMQVGGMVNARFEGIQGRLLPETRLRPPLAADRRVAAKDTGTTSRPATRVPEPRTYKGKGTPGIPVKGKSREVQTAKGIPKQADSRPPAKGTPTQSEQARTLPPPPESMDEGWSTVVKRKRKKKRGKGPSQGQAPTPKLPPPKKVQQAKLRSPRSSAVVITLQPQALREGVTYAKVLTQLRSKIDLASCGIEGAGLQCRQTATGARKLEVSGATSGGKADSLAKMIRQVIGPDTLQVSRPIKCAEMRISGLDDSVSGDELAAVIAQRGGCPVEAVKVGEIRLAAQGAGFAWVRCPVEAAKKIREGGRLLVGWVSARVTVLEARPMQCYRCMQKGHVRAQCAAAVDRSDACYRCGKPGHKAAQCTAAAPKCMLCAAGGKPAEHRMGGKACSPPKPKKTVKAVARPSNAAPLSQGPEGMEIMTIAD